MYLSKSKYCNAVQCNKMLWLDKFMPLEKGEISNQAVLDNGTEVGILAKQLFGKYVDIPFSEHLEDMIKDTNEALKEENTVITEASFDYQGNFCSVDILVKKGNTFELYEVKSSTEIKEIYIDDISYQVYVLTQLGYNVVKSCIVYLNRFYVRKGSLELDKLFIKENVTKIVKEKQKEVQEKIEEINQYMLQKEEPKDDIGMHCMTPYECPFFAHCTKHLPEKNVFKLRRMRNSSKFKFYKQGIYTYEDLVHEKMDKKVKQQIEFELEHKEPEIDKTAIQEFLNTLSYPLYFLDFETYQQSIPLYDDVKPYMQIPFQYSLHYIEKEDDSLKHKEFLAPVGEDPRRKLAEQLVKDIPMNVCTLAYNMNFEKSVIKSLASLFPDLSEHLMNIYENIKDLMVPFYNRSYYVEEMEGSYSIKYVLPALFQDDPSLNYHNLNLIHNGEEAMTAYQNMENLSLEGQEKLRESLLKYCALDTYAMVKIWGKLKECVK